MQARRPAAAPRHPRGRRGGRRNRGTASNTHASPRERSPYGAGHGRNSGESDDFDEDERGFFLPDPYFVSEGRRTSARDESWMFDSLAEQLAGRSGYQEEEDEDDDDDGFESRYYYDSDDDVSDSMFFANLHAMEEASRSTAARSRARSASRPVSTPTPTPTPTPPPEPALCRFFVLGKCRYGSHCTYSHALPEAASDCTVLTEEGLNAAAALVDCPFFQRGNCKYGDFCRLRHANTAAAGTTTRDGGAAAATARSAPCAGASRATAASASISEQTGNQEEFTCGICFEDIVQAGKHFGLLACDHCFCLDCLRSWRQSKDMEVEVIRACPACRQPSDFVVPSLTFCTGDAKARAVEAYKRHLALRECKYFNGAFGSCPFGPHCFYAHRDAHGRDVKHLDRPKRSAKPRRNNSAGGVTEAALSSLLSNYSQFFRFLEMVEMDEYDSD